MVSFSKNVVSNMTKPQTITMSFLLFFQILFIICVTSYTPVDHLAVNCGGFSNTPSFDQRNWTEDFGSPLFSLIDLGNGILFVKVNAPNSKTIPYGTAVLSRSEFSYSFQVTEGQKFIRLHFYPSSYNNFLRSDSLFSVKAGSHTLLKDFNASLAAEETILREYCINVDPSQRLNLTFTPNLSYPNAYAFLNGIEVVSMPTYLYYTNPDTQQMLLDGENSPFKVEKNSALQTVYRINVGGMQIPPKNDNGVFRKWEADNGYMKIERPHSISTDYGLDLKYNNDPKYFAPDEVYKTARNYGMNETSKYNVTWEFQVDLKFFYMVRLHFCEFDQSIQKARERVFHIFIADKLVEGDADVVMWSGNLVPIHRDYAVGMQSDGSLKKLNLLIKLKPHLMQAAHTEMCH